MDRKRVKPSASLLEGGLGPAAWRQGSEPTPSRGSQEWRDARVLSRARLAALLCLLATVAFGGEPADEPGHAVREVFAGARWADSYACPLVPGQWDVVSVEQTKLWYVYRSGRRLALTAGDTQYWVSIDGGPEQLAGIEVGAPDGRAALQKAIADGARDVVVACWHDAAASGASQGSSGESWLLPATEAGDE